MNDSFLSTTSSTVQSQVVVHAPVPQLDLLRVGCAPEIYSSARRSRNQSARRSEISSNETSISQPTTARIFRNDPYGVSLVQTQGRMNSARKRANPRFSTRSQRDAIIDETPPGEIPRTSVTTNYRDRLSKRAKMQQSKLVSEFRQTADFTESMEEKLAVYDHAKKLKTIVHNQDYEDHYLIPLQRRIKEKMMPDNYNGYLTRKAEMIMNIDRDPIPINATPRRMYPIPHMNISTKGLKDPSMKYSTQQTEEKNLMKFISKANGETVREMQIPPPDTLNYKKLNLQTQTRFFFGKDPQANKKGRRAFSCWDASKVGNELDYFQK